MPAFPEQVAPVPPEDPPALALIPAPVGRVWPQRLLTGFVLVGPLVALALVAAQVLGVGSFSIRNVVMAVVAYAVVGHGVTVGFHRLFTHKSFEAKRPLKIVLAVLGSMSVQGSVIGWVAEHRRHHMFTEQPGDPHSPVRPASQRFGRLRGLCHAHAGWFFDHEGTAREKYAPDLLADRDIVVVDRMFIPLTVATFLVPFLLGYAIGGTFSAAFGALLWAGVLRMLLLHHVTWSTNSICHMFGRRPFRTKDASTNFAPLAVLSMGECFHNAHHAFPSMARHGCDPHQLDSSALLIRLFERLGWVTKVRWPDRARLDARRAG